MYRVPFVGMKQYAMKIQVNQHPDCLGRTGLPVVVFLGTGQL